ncbi:MAG: hypothetical protein WA999_02660, partial [Spirulinaceae cyanobacterium]
MEIVLNYGNLLMARLTNTAALILSILTLSSWGGEATQAAEPGLGSSFQQWCLQKANLSPAARKTVDVLLEKAGTTDCELANNELVSLTELDLSN